MTDIAPILVNIDFDCVSRIKDGTPWARALPSAKNMRCRFLLKMDSEPYFLAGAVGRKDIN